MSALMQFVSGCEPDPPRLRVSNNRAFKILRQANLEANVRSLQDGFALLIRSIQSAVLDLLLRAATKTATDPQTFEHPAEPPLRPM